jgi:dUTP pyrophosphatase
MNDKIEIKFVRTHLDAVLPERNHKDILTGDSGYDLTAVEDCVIPARDGNVVPVGLKIGYITPGHWIRIESRSGLHFRYGLSAFNGVVDNSYRGDISPRINNNSDNDYQVKKGDRVAQLVLYPLIAVESSIIDTVEETERGEKGFGSSGR